MTAEIIFDFKIGQRKGCLVWFLKQEGPLLDDKLLAQHSCPGHVEQVRVTVGLTWRVWVSSCVFLQSPPMCFWKRPPPASPSLMLSPS